MLYSVSQINAGMSNATAEVLADKEFMRGVDQSLAEAAAGYKGRTLKEIRATIKEEQSNV